MRVWLVLFALCGTARADSADPKLIPTSSKPPAVEAINFSHQGQIALSVRAAIGMRALLPYNDEYCGQTDADGDAAVCSGRAPFSLDFELAYGVRRKIDLFLEMRLGLEPDFGMNAADQDGARVFHLSPGARFFFSDAGKSKLFTTAQLVIDLSGYKDVTGTGLGTDVGLRNMSGIWFDLDRAYGFYAYVGETATFSRWLRFELELGIGLQGRYR